MAGSEKAVDQGEQEADEGIEEAGLGEMDHIICDEARCICCDQSFRECEMADSGLCLACDIVQAVAQAIEKWRKKDDRRNELDSAIPTPDAGTDHERRNEPLQDDAAVRQGNHDRGHGLRDDTRYK